MILLIVCLCNDDDEWRVYVRASYHEEFKHGNVARKNGKLKWCQIFNFFGNIGTVLEKQSNEITVSVLCCPHHRRADLTAVVRIRAGFDQRARDFVISLGTCVRQRSCPVLRTVGMRHTSALRQKILDTIQMFELDREM